jgi:GH43 family beta-xylosidase
MSTTADRARTRAACAAALLLLVVASAPAQESTRTFFNVLLPDGADPWVYRHADGTYYLTATTGTDITLRRSATLSGIGGGEKRVVWKPPASGPASQNLWAPELHYLRKKWYVYFAADDGKNENHRMFVLENENPDPLKGEFVNKGKLFDPKADRWAIDGTVVELGEKLYFIWSGWEGDENVRQNLYIAPMKDPLTLGGPRVEISRPSLPWEKVGTPHVNEGPQVVIRGQTINLIYSASGSWTDDYCLGLLTAKVGSDPLDPASWKKHDKPVFKSGGGVLAPGHASFPRSPDGKEDWIVYHAARFPGAGWTRNVRAQPFAWNEDGTPSFGAPVSPDKPIALPAGDPPRLRYEAEHATLAGKARTAKHASASGGELVGAVETAESHVEFGVSVPDAGKYVLVVRFAHGTPKNRPATHRLSVNGEDAGTIRYPNSGRDNWSSAFREVELKRGKNTIRFGKGDGVADIDCLDLVLRK